MELCEESWERTKRSGSFNQSACEKESVEEKLWLAAGKSNMGHLEARSSEGVPFIASFFETLS